ncbi:MAG: SDR family oxidoreductase [Polyangiales bacterium]
MYDLKGKSILVAGGTSGLGRATVIELDKLGACVTFLGRDHTRAEEVCAAAPYAVFVSGDLRERTTAAEAVQAAVNAFGHLDGAVNLASSFPQLTPLTELDDDELELELLAELRASVILLREELRYFVAAERWGASIVNVSSINGLGASPRAPAYSAVKAAQIALSKNAALDYAAAGIRVNALVPGPFDTPMHDRAVDIAATRRGLDHEEIERGYRERVPLGRIGEPREAAAAIAWLLSESSSFVTGTSLIIDGGMTSFAR